MVAEGLTSGLPGAVLSVQAAMTTARVAMKHSSRRIGLSMDSAVSRAGRLAPIPSAHEFGGAVANVRQTKRQTLAVKRHGHTDDVSKNPWVARAERQRRPSAPRPTQAACAARVPR